MLRALGEFEISGLSTTIPAHVALCRTPTSPPSHSTKWVEDEVDPASFAVTAPRPRWPTTPRRPSRCWNARCRSRSTASAYSVKLWLPEAAAASAAPRKRPARPARGPRLRRRAGSGTISAPMQGTIVKVLVAAGDAVEAGQSVLVLEAMKMENHITAEKSGTVQEVRVAEGDTVGTGDVLLVIE